MANSFQTVADVRVGGFRQVDDSTGAGYQPMAASESGSIVEICKTWVKSTVTGQRVLLALKAALAVGIAWLLAPLMPGTADDYPYYAPLGVLVSMYPTFMGSVRTGLQTLVGILLGVALAAGVLLLGTPNVLSISLAVGAGVLLAGLPRLGAGSDYVPVATLLVLIIGGNNADAFSLGYGLQMALGVLVGLVVNASIFPPLVLDAAQARIARARDTLIDQLDDAAAALVEQWPPSHEDWARRRHVLDDAGVEVRRSVNEAAESQRANPRAAAAKCGSPSPARKSTPALAGPPGWCSPRRVSGPGKALWWLRSPCHAPNVPARRHKWPSPLPSAKLPNSFTTPLPLPVIPVSIRVSLRCLNE